MKKYRPFIVEYYENSDSTVTVIDDSYCAPTKGLLRTFLEKEIGYKVKRIYTRMEWKSGQKKDSSFIQ